ncbi:uncharacterized protein Dwil_GK12983 [Drosophila willistoni]|uniref:Fatty acyl-CoA reductase n=1 Tax=Drosophila willistoni TaxID=7260 RepID=B4NI26_DROWI|nr:fatty acyl-CoA reductase wat [Drosophila willistoni]EDW84718.2 uncharacterized protein Dwil_GK12983 [Drosophila willistoni]
MDTEIQKFYKNKTLFITGGTGFLGKVIIAKLLLSTDVNRIYMLIRNKRGRELQERIETWGKDPVFNVLLETKPNALDRICPIAGDCLESENLGISEKDRQTLASNVQIVIHSAATVRFDEKLSYALAINVRGTEQMLRIAKTMPHLESFLHISTAFSNCVQLHTEEKFYPDNLTCSAKSVLNLSKQISDELLDNMTSTLMGGYPNTYAYTKGLAENLILDEAGQLPMSVLRPTFIMPAYKEPLPGYIDNFYGPIGYIYGVGMGVLRVALHDVNVRCSFTPVDYSANLALTAIWETAKNPIQSTPKIYNLTPSDNNYILAGKFNYLLRKHGYSYPTTKMIWYPFCHSIATPWLFQLICLFYHTIPGFIIDTGLRFSGRKPRLGNVYKRIHATMLSLSTFLSTFWRFGSVNTNTLWKSLSVEDQRLFNFDLPSLDWDDFTDTSLRGMRTYLAKEPPTAQSLDKALKLLDRYLILHRLLQLFFCSILGYTLWFLYKLF